MLAVPRIRGAFAALALCGLAVGCGYGGYSEHDIRHDALQLVPSNARYVHVLVRKGDGFNPTLSASVTFTIRHRTPRQRVAEYLALARAHGWTVRKHSIDNAHAHLLIRTDYGIVDGTDQLTLVMK